MYFFESDIFCIAYALTCSPVQGKDDGDCQKPRYCCTPMSQLLSGPIKGSTAARHYLCCTWHVIGLLRGVDNPELRHDRFPGYSEEDNGYLWRPCRCRMWQREKDQEYAAATVKRVQRREKTRDSRRRSVATGIQKYWEGEIVFGPADP